MERCLRGDVDRALVTRIEDIESLQAIGAHICQWENSNSTERQLFTDLPWENVPALLTTISENHDTLELATIIDSIRSDPGVAGRSLVADPAEWLETQTLRQVMGDLAHSGSWIKRMDYAEKAFQFSLPLLPDTSTLKSRLGALWTWIQHE